MQQALDAAVSALSGLVNTCSAAGLREGERAASESLRNVQFAQNEMARLLDEQTHKKQMVIRAHAALVVALKDACDCGEVSGHCLFCWAREALEAALTNDIHQEAPDREAILRADRAEQAEAWLFQCFKPGNRMVFASVDIDDTRWRPSDQWEWVARAPLTVCGPYEPLHGAPTGRFGAEKECNCAFSLCDGGVPRHAKGCPQYGAD